MAAAREALRERGQEFGRRIPAIIRGVPLMVASAEDVILSKLQWSKLGGSLRQIEDAAGILELRKTSLDRVYIDEWVDRLGLHDQWNAALSAARLDL